MTNPGTVDVCVTDRRIVFESGQNEVDKKMLEVQVKCGSETVRQWRDDWYVTTKSGPHNVEVSPSEHERETMNMVSGLISAVGLVHSFAGVRMNILDRVAYRDMTINAEDAPLLIFENVRF
jgi:hypothetical protein